MWHGSNAAGDTVSDTVPASLGRCHHHSSCGCCDPQAGGVETCSGVFIRFLVVPKNGASGQGQVSMEPLSSSSCSDAVLLLPQSEQMEESLQHPNSELLPG